MTTLRRSRLLTFVPGAIAALALAACTDQVQPTEPTGGLAPKPLADIAGPQIVPGLFGPTFVSASSITTTVGHVAICKSGATGHIDIVIRQQGTGPGTVPQPTDPIVYQATLTLQNGQCAVFHGGDSQQFTVHAHESQQFTVGATTTFLDNITAFTIGSTTTAVPCGSNATDLCAINMGPGNITVGGVQYGPGSVVFGELNAFHGGLATFFNHEETRPCDFITFGRLEFTVDGHRIVISGNAGGFKADGSIIGHVNIQVDRDKWNVQDITDYFAVTSGSAGELFGTNVREIQGTATNGDEIRLRLRDNPAPGAGEPTSEGDRVWLWIEGRGVVVPNLPTEQGNIQLHLNCRGPGDEAID